MQVLLLLLYMVYSYVEYIDAKDGETVQVLLLLLYSIELCSVQGWGNCTGTIIVIVMYTVNYVVYIIICQGSREVLLLLLNGTQLSMKGKNIVISFRFKT